MSGNVKKALWFLSGVIVFLLIEGFFYHAPQAVNATVAGVSGFAFLGDGVFIVWALVVGFISGKKGSYNLPFIFGATLGCMIASLSIKPLLVTSVVFALFYLVFKSRHEAA